MVTDDHGPWLWRELVTPCGGQVVAKECRVGSVRNFALGHEDRIAKSTPTMASSGRNQDSSTRTTGVRGGHELDEGALKAYLDRRASEIPGYAPGCALSWWARRTTLSLTLALSLAQP